MYFRLLLALLSTASLMAPAYSKQIYLLIYASRGTSGITSTVLPMESMEQCQAAGLKIIAKKFKHSDHEFDCINGGRIK